MPEARHNAEVCIFNYLFLPMFVTTMVMPGMMKDNNVDIIVIVGVKLATQTELAVVFCVSFVPAFSSSSIGRLLMTTVMLSIHSTV